jgi:DNA ligase-1
MSKLTSFVQAIKTCESFTGAGKKKVIQEALASLDEVGRKLVFYAMNAYYTYGVKKFERPSLYSQEDGDPDLIFTVLDELRSREATGNIARMNVTLLLSAFTAETASYIERVIEKDLKAGFSIDTFNKVWPSEPIPDFKVMLADKCETEEQYEELLQSPVLGDWKYDGERNITLVPSPDKISHISRSGLEAFHLDGLFDEELRDIYMYTKEHWGWDGFVLDSERFARDWNDTVNAKKSGNQDSKARMFLMMFFIMPYKDWEARSCSITMMENRDNIAEILGALQHITRLRISSTKLLKSYADVIDYCDAVTMPGFDGRKNGHEGLILKRTDAVYRWDRSLDWCKVKKFHTADGIIVSVKPGRAKSKYENTTGRLNVKGRLENGEVFECGVGSGLKDWERDAIRDNPEQYLNGAVTVEIKYQDTSKIKGRETLSLRFPTLHRIRTRDDKIINPAEVE